MTTVEREALAKYQKLYKRTPEAGFDYCSANQKDCGCGLPTHQELLRNTLNAESELAKRTTTYSCDCGNEFPETPTCLICGNRTAK